MSFLNDKIKAIGTKLEKVKSVGEQSNLIIGSLTSIGEIGVEASENDITTHDSPNRAKEFMAGEIDAGDLSFSGIFKKKADEATVVKMLTLLKSGSIESWIVTFPSGAKWEFKAHVKSFKTVEANVDGNVGFSGSLRISGIPTYTPSV